MFGLKKEKFVEFEFDLEKDLADKTKLRAMMSQNDSRINEIKHVLRKGAPEEDFEELGLLLQAYDALDTVYKRIKKNK